MQLHPDLVTSESKYVLEPAEHTRLRSRLAEESLDARRGRALVEESLEDKAITTGLLDLGMKRQRIRAGEDSHAP